MKPILLHIMSGYQCNKAVNKKDVTNTENGDRGMGNGERGTGNGERGTGNGEPGTGVWEQVYIGNPLENEKWRLQQKKRVEEKQFGLR